ncbi:NB-ARC domain-containing protein [Promicromonospora sp. NFX87]|uniref:NB-ARC domain-containing protein n=1 Tax=Promicromonospora sp. NFX87 TaxID=3402691 RepID=UPI003AFA1EAB
MSTEQWARGRTSLLFLHGPEGIGRSCLVAEYFHANRALFDLYIDVVARQPDDRPVSQGELLGQALRGLGMADADLPISDAARLEAYRRLSARRRFLIVVKDPVSAEQVRNLIPADAPEAAVVATTRTMQRDLLTLEFADVLLSKLPPAESRELLEHCMGAAAAQVSSATIDELARLCDGFPLLIRILGAQLKGRPRVAQRYLRDLRASQSALLMMGEARRFASFLDVAYGDLEEVLKRAYRHLALLPGSSFGADAAAVVLGVDVDQAERLLDDLVDRNLVLFDDDIGRYSFYRIVQADARRRLLEADGPEVVRSSTGLITIWYLREAVPRDAVLASRWRVGAEFDRHAAADLEPLSRASATEWFDAEWESVVACVGAAHDQGLHDVAWQLCVAVFKYLHLHGHVDTWLDSHRLGVASARACGDHLGMMQVTSQRGAAYLAIGDTDRARTDFEASLRAAVQAGHRLGEQSAWEWLGKAAAEAGELSTAFRCYDESESVIDRSVLEIPAEQQARMRALLGLHRARARLVRGELERADAEATDALEYFRSTEELDNQAKCLMAMGGAVSGGEDFVKAAEYYERAAALFSADGARRAQAGAMLKLGDARRAVGDDRGAAKAFSVSRELYTALADATADEAGARLTDLNEQ